MTHEPELPARMNATDALFWLLDPIPEFRSGIGGLMLLDGMPDSERLRDQFRSLAASYPRMVQRVVDAPFGIATPEWVPDEDFDLDYHLRTIAVAPPATLHDLLDELGPLFATPLDRNRPLWEAYVTGPLAGGRSAVFMKVHHCLMDGVGATRLLTGLLGVRQDETAPPCALPRLPSPSLALPARLFRAAAYELDELRAVLGESAAWLGEAARHPAVGAGRIAGALRSLRGIGRELGGRRIASPIHRQRSLSRRLATLDMSLADIDAVRASLGATNNDVLLTIVSGALHRWHTSRGADVKELKALVPVNLRDTDDDAAGNRLALLAVGLPIGEPNPIRRLREVQERMGRVKRDRRATLYPLVANVVRALPAPLAAQVVQGQMRRANFVCTNVPGPTATCWLAGRPIEAIYAFAPMVGDHPVAIAAYRYRERVHVGLDVDPLAIGDLARFRDAFGESYAEVIGLAGRPEARVVGAGTVT